MPSSSTYLTRAPSIQQRSPALDGSLPSIYSRPQRLAEAYSSTSGIQSTVPSSSSSTFNLGPSGSSGSIVKSESWSNNLNTVSPEYYSLKGKEKASNQDNIPSFAIHPSTSHVSALGLDAQLSRSRSGQSSGVQEEREDDEPRELERNYGPPKAPLTPHQLSRIAQSFGIVIPSLPPPSSPSPTCSPLLHTSPTFSSTAQLLPYQPGPSSSSSSRYIFPPKDTNTSSRQPIQSPFLLTVIPPLSLLSLKSTSAEEAEKRTKKWKRGRLIPLQSSLQGMLISIAREFGLPSTNGLQIYLSRPSHPPLSSQSNSHSHRHDSSSSSRSGSYSSSLGLGGIGRFPAEEDIGSNGPEISPQTWPIVFGNYLNAYNGGGGSSTSRSSTPIQTPNKSTGELGRDIAFPLSPLTLLAERKAKLSAKPFSKDLSLPNSSKLSSSVPSTAAIPHSATINHHSTTHTAKSDTFPQESTFVEPLPVTPVHSEFQLPLNPIIGVIEFDVDPENAKWFTDWKKQGGRYKKSSHSISNTPEGVRQLRLPRKLSASPRFLRDLSRTNGYGQGLSPSSKPLKGANEGAIISSGDTTLIEDSSDSQAEQYISKQDTRFKQFPLPPLRQSSVSRKRLSVKQGNGQGMLSNSASFGEFDDTSFSSSTTNNDLSISRSSNQSNIEIGDVTNDDSENLLDPPIDLGMIVGERIEKLRYSVIALANDNSVDGLKRGSAQVMSEQLDDLERLMRSLSPRDIRLTSPRMLTPRMADKVASANLQFPSNPKSSSTSSGLRSGPSPLAQPLQLTQHDAYQEEGTYPGNSIPKSDSASSFQSRISAHSTKSCKTDSGSSSSTTSISAKGGGLAPPINDLIRPAGKSNLTINTMNTFGTQSTVPSFDATTLTRPPLEARMSEDDYEFPRPSWPAVPYKPGPESPGSPGSLDGFFKSKNGSVNRFGNGENSSPISDETLSRMRDPVSPPRNPSLKVNGIERDLQYGHGHGHSYNNSEDWKPSRPSQRPPSLSNSSENHNNQYSLSPDLYDHLKQSPNSGGSPGGSGVDGDSNDKKNRKSRSGSISLKGLKNMGFGKKRGSNIPIPPPLPIQPSSSSALREYMTDGRYDDKISPTPLPGSSSFQNQAGLMRGSTSIKNDLNRNGSVMSTSTTNSIPKKDNYQAGNSAANSGNGFRWNVWGKKDSPKMDNNASSLKSSNSNSTKSSSKRSPSMDTTHTSHSTHYYQYQPPKIGSPVSGTFKHVGHGHSSKLSISSIPPPSQLHQQQRGGIAQSNTLHTLASLNDGEKAGEGDFIPRDLDRSFGEGGQYDIANSPGSPNSLKSVKRKAVPFKNEASNGTRYLGNDDVIRNSESMGSVRSFAMDKPGEERNLRGVGLGLKIA